MEKIKIVFFIIALYSITPNNKVSFLVNQTFPKISYSKHKKADNQEIELTKKKFEIFSLLGFLSVIISIVCIASGTASLWFIGSLIAVIFALISHFRFNKREQFKGKIFNILTWINFGAMIFFIAFVILVLMSINIQCK